MRVWARMFRSFALQPVTLDMPDGAYWMWVERNANALSDAGCDGAEQMPFVAGSEPRSESDCLRKLGHGKKKSFWRKWFDQDR